MTCLRVLKEAWWVWVAAMRGDRARFNKVSSDDNDVDGGVCQKLQAGIPYSMVNVGVMGIPK